MATGDITATYEGAFDITSAAFLTEMNTLNVGAATVGSNTAVIYIIPDQNMSNMVHIIKAAQAA